MIGKEVRIEIDTETGAMKIEADGYVGKQCEDATVWIERALGRRTEQTKKPEFNRMSPLGKSATQSKGLNAGQG